MFVSLVFLSDAIFINFPNVLGSITIFSYFNGIRIFCQETWKVGRAIQFSVECSVGINRGYKPLLQEHFAIIVFSEDRICRVLRRMQLVELNLELSSV